MLYELCEKNGIPHKRVGKWILAQNEKERNILEGLHEKCKRLGVPTSFIDKEEAQKIEPDVSGRISQSFHLPDRQSINAFQVQSPFGVLNSPTTGIVSSHDLMTHLSGVLEDAAGDISLLTSVVDIKKSPSGGYEVWTKYGSDDEVVTITADLVINSAGLFACQISNMLLPKERHVTPYYAKGNYFSYAAGKPKVSRLIYPCPVKGLGGLGTHLTLDLAGRMRFGPDVEWVDSPDDLIARDSRLEEAIGAVKIYLPEIDKGALSADYCGIRPKLQPKGGEFQDFIVREEEGFPGFVNLLGIESPGKCAHLKTQGSLDD